ncbi:hypothetical protein [Ramlibacter alkalitolerans]|uniref:DUF4375 domain-containing protein n=1 Tax=Ramlibacter alkalitolerans TaxID=2039631 RepID=A0ABS1JWD0_9BURK|nr:hypothetical protein [Ramlibacter alkalitolerans]MBL0427845.1 hypothetical protein [Ramlibacter alkalitolerans]
MQDYLVVSTDEPARPEETYVVRASSPEEALTKYIKQVYLPSDFFREWVRELAVNMGFAERFYLASEQELERFTGTGEYGTEPELVRSRVAAFFKERPDLGAAYLEYMDTEDESVLSDELFEFIALHRDPLTELGLRAIALASLPVLE